MAFIKANLATLYAAIILTAVFPFACLADDNVSKTAYERVKTSGVIRCGYLIYAPFITKDINTGTLGGLTVETMEEIGKELGYKIEWTEEVSMTTAFEAMESKRFDMACIPFWITPPRVKVAEPTVPLYYDGYFAFIRPENTKFQGSYEKVNSEDVTISIQEGAAIQTMLSKYFPKAKVTEQMALSDPMMQLQDVMTKKADVAFVEMSLYKDFEKIHPGEVKLLSNDPLMVMPAALWLPSGDFRLKALADHSIKTIQYNGTMDKLLDKYGGRSIFSYVSKPYDPVASTTTK